MGDSEEAQEAPSKRPGGTRALRSLLLRYVLYDALVRPTEWHYAPGFCQKRLEAWRGALQKCFKGSSRVGATRAALLPSPRELSVLPLVAGREASLASGNIDVFVFQPVRATAAALRAAAKDNGALVLHYYPCLCRKIQGFTHSLAGCKTAQRLFDAM